VNSLLEKCLSQIQPISADSYRQLCSLSAGTLATISGLRRYSDLEEFHQDLCGLYQVFYSQGERWESWVDFFKARGKFAIGSGKSEVQP